MKDVPTLKYQSTLDCLIKSHDNRTGAFATILDTEAFPAMLDTEAFVTLLPKNK
jgi:hypothetical protein